jgi:hypothetical protein
MQAVHWLSNGRMANIDKSVFFRLPKIVNRINIFFTPRSATMRRGFNKLWSHRQARLYSRYLFLLFISWSFTWKCIEFHGFKSEMVWLKLYYLCFNKENKMWARYQSIFLKLPPFFLKKCFFSPRVAPHTEGGFHLLFKISSYTCLLTKIKCLSFLGAFSFNIFES